VGRVENSKRTFRVAVVGGGPGGLFTAWHLAYKAGTSCQITIYEASDRLGGKIVTNEVAGIGLYEAGVAEIYDYSGVGPDPLRDLIENDLGLTVKGIAGGSCVLNGKILPNAEALGEHFGAGSRDQAAAFRARCLELLDPAGFYKSARSTDNAHIWAKRTGEELLTTEFSDEMARRYVRIMAHSDVAAPPHLTNGLTFLKNALMDADGYLDVISVVGGNEQIVRRLEDEIDADVQFNSPVQSVQPLSDGTFKLEVGVNGARHSIVADYVVLALPLTALSMINWKSGTLQQSIARHISYFDRPGHYLRATLFFERPFWREHINGAWWMMDAFDGCCVYDEGARHDLGQWGALGFLIAGNAALGLANISDDRIEELCLDALPPELAFGRRLLIDRRIHRWMASVNAIPGGFPVRTPYQNHRPLADQYPNLLMVGDYMFDATLNGVLDSADAATDILLADVLDRRRALDFEVKGAIGADAWPPVRSEEVCYSFFSAQFLTDMLQIVWGLYPGARVLHVGSGNGTMVRALRAIGFDALGVAANRLEWAQTPEDLKQFNTFGDLTKLNFSEREFDVVLENGLCQLSREEAAVAIAEIKRVTRRGIILGSVVTDLAIDLIERLDLLAGVKTLTSRWDWSDQFFAMGFDFALGEPARLDVAWKRAVAAGAGPGHWYEDAEGLMYCFFNVGDEVGQAEALRAAPSVELPAEDDESRPSSEQSRVAAAR
jgi:monoamine oxidase/SAM-dependent methyltransferase